MTINLLVQNALTEAKHSPVRFLGISISIIFAVYIFFNEFTRKAARIPGLTGPSGLPLIGNLLQRRENAAEKYRQWARSHGSVYKTPDRLPPRGQSQTLQVFLVGSTRKR